jgi:predicted RNase H-like HicB family nuclease
MNLNQKGEVKIDRVFSLEYWIDNNWYVGRLKEVPSVFSQGESLEEVEEKIRDAYQLMLEEDEISHNPGRPLFPATLKSKKASVI